MFSQLELCDSMNDGAGQSRRRVSRAWEDMIRPSGTVPRRSICRQKLSKQLHCHVQEPKISAPRYQRQATKANR